MNHSFRKIMMAALVICLCFCMGMMPALADTGVKSETGAFAANGSETSGIVYMVLPVGEGYSLYSMPKDGGMLTLIETANYITDLISDVSGNIYYMRYNGATYQAIVRTADGTAIVAAQFPQGQIAHSLSLYNGKLYCLVDNHLNEIDINTRTAKQISDCGISSYTIADGIIYYESSDDMVEYQMASGVHEGSYVLGSNGKLESMYLDGSANMVLLSEGVSNISAYGDYVYFHNLNDSYIVSSDVAEWLDGCLYRINVQTNQFIRVLSEYDWSYRPTDFGLVIYREGQLLMADLSGENQTLMYEPDPYNYMAILDDCTIIYEYNTQKLTRVDYSTMQPTVLWTGNFVSNSTTGEVIKNEAPEATVTAAATDATVTAQNTPAPVQSTTGNTDPAIVAPSATPYSGYTAKGSMMYGAKGDDVKKVQQRLKDLGYLSGSVDGIFGNKTKNAVIAFQKRAGLTADGIVGNATLTKLNSSSAPYAPSGDDSGYLLPNSSKTKLTENDVLSLDKKWWPYARNEIYARHGYIFNNDTYQKYFNQKSWYKKNSKFSTSDLNSVEWYNMKLIKDMEDKYKDKPTPTHSSNPTTKPTSDNMPHVPEAAKKIGASSYIFANSSNTKLTQSDIEGISKTLWPYARNEIYARHGYTFTKAKFSEYFENKTWYSKKSGFSTSQFNSTEWYNIKLIKWMEDNK